MAVVFRHAPEKSRDLRIHRVVTAYGDPHAAPCADSVGRVVDGLGTIAGRRLSTNAAPRHIDGSAGFPEHQRDAAAQPAARSGDDRHLTL